MILYYMSCRNKNNVNKELHYPNLRDFPTVGNNIYLYRGNEGIMKHLLSQIKIKLNSRLLHITPLFRNTLFLPNQMHYVS